MSVSRREGEGMGKKKRVRPSTLAKLLAVVAPWVFVTSCAVEEPPGVAEGLGYVESVGFGSLDGQDALPEAPMDLLVTDSGDFIVLTASRGADSRPFVFDAQGSFSGRIGGAGEGPGEFAFAMVGTPLPGDSLLIHDMMQSRATVFTPEGQVGRIIQFGGQVTELIPIAWPDTVIAVVWPSGQPGRWYRVFGLGGTSAETIGEFGPAFPTDFQAMVGARRFASPGTSGRLWTIDNLSYELRGWTTHGDSVSVVRPESNWFGIPNQGFGPDSVPETHIVEVQHVGGDTVAIGLSVAREVWQEAWSGIDLTGSEVIPPAAAQLYEGVIEFRDATDGRLLGSQRFPGIVFAILPDSRIATYRLVEPGYPRITVYER